MKKSIFVLIWIQIVAALAFSQEIPTLVFNGVNGYPSIGNRLYRIDIYVAANGLISEIKSFIGNSTNVEETTKIIFEKQRISGETNSRDSRTAFDFELLNKELHRHIIIYNSDHNSIFSEKSSIVRIAPQSGVYFETDSRRYIQSSKNDFQVIDITTNENLYKFNKNQIENEGWYRSDWKLTGNTMIVHEYVTMEKFAEWIDAGHGVFTGKAFANSDQSKNVINFCILDAVYPNNPIFLPFIFGLKTGSY